MVRAFLAIDPPEEILREIGRIQERLKRLIRGDLRWVRPEGIHLTLKFFGDVPDIAVDEISAVAGKAAAEVAPFELEIGGAGVFPGPARPRVVWLGINGDLDRLVAFQQRLGHGFREAGFPSEERPFRPHLTLARIRSSKGLTGLDEMLKKEETAVAGRFTASGPSLFQSNLTPGGAVYTRLASYPFTVGEGRQGAGCDNKVKRAAGTGEGD